MSTRSILPVVDTAIHNRMLPISVWWLLSPTGKEERTGNTGVIPGRPRRCNQISNLNHFTYLAWTSFITIAIAIPDREKVLFKHV